MGEYNYYEESIKELNFCRKEFGLSKRQYEYTLDSTTPCEGQEAAFEAVQLFADKFTNNENPAGLLLIGGVGSGKTFLASCVANQILRNTIISLEEFAAQLMDLERNKYGYGCSIDWFKKTYNVQFITTIDLMDQLRAQINSECSTWDFIIEKMREVNLLILDDLGAEKASDWVREILFKIIDYRYNEGLPMIVTTNCVPDELKEKIGARNFDRLREMCAMVPVTAKSQRVTATL